MQTSNDLQSTFSRAFALLTANWVIVVPGVVVSLLALIVGVFFTAGAIGSYAVSNGGAAGIVGVALIGLIGAAVVLLLTIAQLAYITGMAAQAWETGSATLVEGAHTFAQRGPALLLLLILLFVIGLVAIVLAPFTLFLSLLAYGFFFMYAIPGVVIGNEEATIALSESGRLAWGNLAPSLIILIAVAFVSFLGHFIGMLFGVIPVIGTLIGLLIGQVAVAYGALVVVGEYLKLRQEPPVAPQ
ncbi:MAG: hypothetical protein ACYDA5_04350 [Vulcanimicrobiaceae bacterium]